MSEAVSVDSAVPPALAQAIVHAAAEAIILADRDGVVRLWNSGAERMFGYPAGEALGESLDLIIPDKHRQRHWEGYERVMETGVTRYADTLLSVPAVHRDGHRVFVQFSVALLQDDAGNDKGAVTGIAAIMRDVTRRDRP
ncbi:MAG: PAS domain-containing protein [Streptosporangiaceae bacterium]